MNKITALAYHSIGDYPNSTYNIDISVFKEHMHLLKAEGYTVEGLHGYGKRKTANDWPSRYVLLTFDDGYKSFLKAADIIGDCGFTGTFFITKEWCLKRDNFLSNPEIIELGLIHEIGSHTVSHPNLTRISQQSIHYELLESKKWIEELIQSPVTSLAVPGGYINSDVITAALEIGYQLIGNSKEWWNITHNTKTPNIINRVAVRRAYSIQTFHDIIDRNIYYYLRRRARAGILSMPKKLLSEQQIKMLYKILKSFR
ncbi:polysaccharide deacetylase family protein [Gemmatimonadota bacterium]